MIVLRIKIWPSQNQFWKGYKIQVFNIKIIFIIINILLQLCYIPNYIKILLPGAPCIKNLDGMIITLVPREKSRKLACVPNGTEMLSIKATTKTCLLHNIIQKAVDNNLLEDRIPNLWQIKLKFSQPTPPLYNPPHPCMTHPTPPLHDPPHPYWGAPFGRHTALGLFHFIISTWQTSYFFKVSLKFFFQYFV